jgi:glucosamine-phosphate N-acetyltransferase
MIRALTVDDYDNGFETILAQKFKVAISKHEFKYRLAITQNPNSGHFVIEINSRIVGYVKYLLETKFSPDKMYVGHIEDLFIIKEFRNNGYGRDLAYYCVEFLKSHDCYKIILNCKSDLVKFYEKLGLVKSSEMLELKLL